MTGYRAETAALAAVKAAAPWYLDPGDQWAVLLVTRPLESAYALGWLKQAPSRSSLPGWMAYKLTGSGRAQLARAGLTYGVLVGEA